MDMREAPRTLHIWSYLSMSFFQKSAPYLASYSALVAQSTMWNSSALNPKAASRRRRNETVSGKRWKVSMKMT